MLDNNGIVVIHMQHNIFKGNAHFLVVEKSNKKNPQEITVKSWNFRIISDFVIYFFLISLFRLKYHQMGVWFTLIFQ